MSLHDNTSHYVLRKSILSFAAFSVLMTITVSCKPEETEIKQPVKRKERSLDPNAFSVSIQTQDYEVFQYDRSNPSELCQIDANSNATDMYCMVEVQELDLYFNGLTMDINVPPGMCDYVIERPYHFYAHEVAHGEAGGGTPSSSPPGSIWKVVSNGATTYSPDSKTNPNINFEWINGNPVCRYDHTAENGPNCCMGTYDMTVITVGATQTTQTVETDIEWGGDLASCLYGPALATQPLTQSGLPKLTIYPATAGHSSTYTVDAPIDQGISNIYAANYFDSTDWQAQASQSAPSMLLSNSPQLPSNNAQTYTPSAFYEYECVDSAREVLHRIRVAVREWNTENEFFNHTNDDVDGNEPGWLADPWSFFLLNDHTDIDDLLKPEFGSYYYPGTPQF